MAAASLHGDAIPNWADFRLMFGAPVLRSLNYQPWRYEESLWGHHKVYAGSSGSGTLTAQTLNTYDGVAIPASGNTSANPAPNHDYTNFPASYNFRGNLTQVSRGLKSGSTSAGPIGRRSAM